MRRKSSRKKSNTPSILTALGTFAANAAADQERERRREKREVERERVTGVAERKREREKQRAAQETELQRELDTIAAHFELAQIHYTDGKYSTALNELNQTIALDDKHIGAYVMKGMIYSQDSSTVQAAIANYSKAIELAPMSGALFRRGVVYIETEGYDKAISDFDRSIELDPSNVDAYAARGYTYKLKGQYERALTDLNRAIGLQPDNELALSIRQETIELIRNSKLFISDAIERLANLRDKGFLTEEEFLSQKARLLNEALTQVDA